MHRNDKEKVVADLVERLRSTDSLIVADYRGLTNAQLVELRAKLRASGAQLKVVKNTLTRRAAEEAGTEALLALLEGPTAIAFVETDGDPVAVAKALADAAKDTKVLALRGGILSGQTLSGAQVEELAKLPAPEIVKSQLVGVIVAPLTQLAALLGAPLRDLVGLIDARIAQLEEGETPPLPRRAAEESDTERQSPKPRSTAHAARPRRRTSRGTRGRPRPADEAGPRRRPQDTPEASERHDALRDAENADTEPRRSRDGNGYREGARDARQDDRARARRAEEGDRGGVGRHRRRSGRGRCGGRARRWRRRRGGGGEGLLRRRADGRPATRRSR